MHTITSKRHPIKFYLVLIFSTLLFLAMAAACLYNYIDEEAGKNVKARGLMPIFAGVIILLAIYSVIRYFKNVPRMIIRSDGITITGKTYLFSDIKEAELTGKQPFPYLSTFWMEGAELIFKDDKKVYIYDDMYANSAGMKTMIDASLQGEDQGEYSIAYVENAIVDHSTEGNVYKGSMVFSMRGFLFFLITGTFTFIMIEMSKEKFELGWVVFLSTFVIFWTIFSAWLMHYFKLTNDLLIVKNHIFPWKRHVFRLSGIREIAFESEGKRPDCLRVITKNYKSKLYPAGTLRRKAWLKMKAELESQNIRVRNECIIED